MYATIQTDMQSYLFFGPPGSGKGTQKGMLEDVLNAKKESLIVIETGQLLRDFVEKKDTEIKKYLSKIMESGGLVPSAFPITTWVNKLINEEKKFDHIIVDGAGRKLVEAKIIVELLHFFPNPNVHIVFLDVHDEEVMTRLLKRGRYDDKDHIIENRLEKYRDEEVGTMASINFLKENKDVTFHDVNGVGTEEEVHQRVISALGV